MNISDSCGSCTPVQIVCKSCLCQITCWPYYCVALCFVTEYHHFRLFSWSL